MTPEVAKVTVEYANGDTAVYESVEALVHAHHVKLSISSVSVGVQAGQVNLWAAMDDGVAAWFVPTKRANRMALDILNATIERSS
jgi:hypothetical protein